MESITHPEELITIDPLDLKFTLELKKQITCSFQLSNKSDHHVAFKVMTTNPKKYFVRPNNGIVLPRSQSNVTVTMQALREVPQDMQCNDKFLVQRIATLPGTMAKDITREMFNKETGNHVEESKLRVSYVHPCGPPSSMREESEEETSAASKSAASQPFSFKIPAATTKSAASMKYMRTPEKVVEERHTMGASQTTLENRLRTPEEKEKVHMHIANFFYENGIPFDAAHSSSISIFLPPQITLLQSPWNQLQEELITIDPLDLKFTLELMKQITCSFQLSNKSDHHVAFKVMTTNPKKYSVRPNNGIVLPRSQSNVTVTMQALREVPQDMQCNDKFLVQRIATLPGTMAKDITREMFNKETGNHVEESKLGVSYVHPCGPPSSMREESEEETSAASKSAASQPFSFKIPAATTKSAASMKYMRTPEKVVEERHTMGASQTTLENRLRTPEEKEKAHMHIANFFYENGIPFDAAHSRSYEVMVESIGQYGPGLKPPSYHELRVPLLKKAKEETEKLKEKHEKPPSDHELTVPLLKKAKEETEKLKKKHEKAWKRYGCILM